MHRSHWTVPRCAGLILLLLNALAHAEPSESRHAEPSEAELAAARDLFNEARRAEEAGRWDEAIIKLHAVAKVKTTPQVRFHLGLCDENLGRLVEALNHFERARAEAADLGLTTVVAEAKEHAATVRARTAKLELVVTSGPEPTRVDIDGQPMASVLLARPLSLDPGRHQITATAPGLAYSKEVQLVERQALRLEIELAPSRTAPSKEATGLSASSIAASSTSPAINPKLGSADAATSTGSSSTSSTVGWVLVGAGGAALGGAVAAAVVRSAALGDIEDTCPTHTGCPHSLENTVTRARTANALGVGLGLGAGVAAGAGLLMLLTSSRSTTTGAVTWTPWLGAQGAGTLGAVAW